MKTIENQLIKLAYEDFIRILTQQSGIFQISISEDIYNLYKDKEGDFISVGLDNYKARIEKVIRYSYAENVNCYLRLKLMARIKVEVME